MEGWTSPLQGGQGAASSAAAELSSSLQEDIRTYRLWLRRREEETARQQTRLSAEMAAAETAARAALGRLASLESQMGLLARGVEALAGRVEAVSEDMAVLRGGDGNPARRCRRTSSGALETELQEFNVPAAAVAAAQKHNFWPPVL
ncbi:hypothetical protein VOLCADRAFT_91037 [Volvox carteri f. nagariensis]|uniref:Uncharacterized protein n=1 Tax=Volvox carteri f. nagariensis TaxID=3068 RepID=D8TW08_VOLCA|nr:uncharacterized protein VOLCADRAFT_91037 [Volvox carteri f. nagariensis]EFJ48395.1 hypothetical protein VOLCADRAFT_91037 [Volvox carteri f. nagariensis]|eukprot:XP_002950649.1 hypothetical protein VOLCADRAFT_91037 [Volvox carteri f. nagariensis]